MLAMNEMAARWRQRQTGTDRQTAGRKEARARSASAPQTKDAIMPYFGPLSEASPVLAGVRESLNI